MEPKLVKAFEINATVGKPSFIGQDNKAGRRQLIAITGGELTGFALPWHGVCLPDGVDSQVVRPNGRAELLDALLDLLGLQQLLLLFFLCHDDTIITYAPRPRAAPTCWQ